MSHRAKQAHSDQLLGLVGRLLANEDGGVSNYSVGLVDLLLGTITAL